MHPWRTQPRTLCSVCVIWTSRKNATASLVGLLLKFKLVSEQWKRDTIAPARSGAAWNPQRSVKYLRPGVGPAIPEGVSETRSISGCQWPLFAGQPVVLLQSTDYVHTCTCATREEHWLSVTLLFPFNYLCVCTMLLSLFHHHRLLHALDVTVRCGITDSLLSDVAFPPGKIKQRLLW